MNIIVYGPGNFNPGSGGILACHKLIHNVELLGHKGFMVADHLNPKYRGTSISLGDATRLAKQPDTIVVYPEIVNGNPLGAPKVVRWILNSPGALAGDENTYGKGDHYYMFANYFKVKYPERIKGELRAMELYLDFFNNTTT